MAKNSKFHLQLVKILATIMLIYILAGKRKGVAEMEILTHLLRKGVNETVKVKNSWNEPSTLMNGLVPHPGKITGIAVAGPLLGFLKGDDYVVYKIEK
ncbi:hypothetical protein TNCT_548361 [Trichonephila clavata]|uniref:Uncharacterized protein n=1 Tax=Trichonephila clavata TaxID=2740835 RepID=A0A8X6G631_TRICU|nr:hypothetical protein TNCT_548361 [Trichonephila clavata]